MLMATNKVIDKAKKIAAHAMGVDEVDFQEGVFVNRQTNQTLTMKEVALLAANPNKIPPDMEPGLNGNAVYHQRKANYPSGTHICELEIDEETGEVEMLNYNIVDDVGVVMNPLLLKGQIHGGVAMGIGQMLLEDLSYDENGELLTASFMDYAMPHADNMSSFNVKSHSCPTPSNPLGVKGAGEAGCVGALPAVGNALVDALSHLGIDDVPMPATPQVLWRLIHERRRAQAAE